MHKWHAWRANFYDEGFLPTLAACGVNAEQWDKVAPMVENVICGCTDAKLNKEFPARGADLRLFLTESSLGVPALRLSFLVNGEGRVVYVAGALR